MDDNNFYSIDRLVEFGLGIAVAQQMVRTMNESMHQMSVPGSFTMQRTAQPALFYAMLDGSQAGPFTEHEMADLIQQKRIVHQTYMWKPGMPSWMLAGQIPEVVRLVALAPPPHPPNTTKP